jgi:DNA end-binding protein Ku
MARHNECSRWGHPARLPNAHRPVPEIFTVAGRSLGVVVNGSHMLDLARHIVNQKTATFDPAKFEDHYESALTELINQERSGKPITAKARPKGENVVDLMEALKRNIGNEAQATKGKKPRKAAAGQKEMLLPISGKRAAKQDAKKADKPAAARTRKRA